MIFNDKNNNDNTNNFNTSIEQQLVNFGNLTFLKEYSSLTPGTATAAQLAADYSIGATTATYAATRSASAPATYTNSLGVVQTTTTSDVGRITGGYWNDTGFVQSVGLIVEAASTNLIPVSTFIEDAAWTKTNTTAANNDTGSSSPDGTLNVPSLTATAANGTLVLASAVTAQTYSVWIKRKTGSGSIDLTADGGSTWTTVTLVSGWGRYQVSAASASQTCGIRIVTSGDAIYVWGHQFEAKGSATSYIPTTSVALARGAETISYETADNLNNATNTISVQLTAFLNAADYAANASIFSTTADAILLQFNTNDQTRFLPNSTDSSTVLANVGIRNTRFRKNVITGISHGATAGTNAECALNTDYFVPTTSNYTEPAAGSAMSLGGNVMGIYHALVIYSDNKSNADVNSISQLLGYSPRPRLLPLGDSITRGNGDADDFGYRDHLQTALGNNTYLFIGSQRWPSATPGAGPSIYGAGVAGDKTSDVLARLSTELATMAANKISDGVVLLMIGTNDCSGGIAAATAVANVSTIISRINSFNPAISIYISNCIPRDDSFDDEVTTYNGLLQTMVEAYSKDNLYFIDMNAVWLANPTWVADWMADTVHPNDTGYQQISAAWYNSMLINGDA